MICSSRVLTLGTKRVSIECFYIDGYACEYGGGGERRDSKLEDGWIWMDGWI